MRSILSLTIALFFVLMSGCKTSSVTSYVPVEQLWQQVDSFDQQNLPRSGLTVVETIYQRSKAEKNTIDYIKSVVHRAGLMEAIEEDAIVKIISELEMEVDSLWTPARQLTHSVLGDLYFQFYTSNQWKLLEKGDVTTNSSHLHEMSAREIALRARNHYMLSFEDKALLASEPSEKYLPLLLEGDQKLHLRPTLYDMLVDRSVEKFLDDAFFTWSVSDGDELENDSLLADRSQFLQMSLPLAADSLPTTTLAIELLQEWLRYRENEGNVEALIDVDLLRLKLLYQLNESPSVLDIYEQTLKQLKHQTKGLDIQASVLYSHARLLYQYNWRFGDDENENRRKAEAYELAKEAAEVFPESEGGRLAQALMEQISRPELSVQTEGVVSSDEAVKYMIQYANVALLHSYIYPLSDMPFDNLRMPDEEWILSRLKATQPVWEGHTEMPDFGDYENHSAELLADTVLPYGLYCVLVSDESFDAVNPAKNKLFQYSLIQVSDLAYMELAGNSGATIAVRDRETGMPIEGALVDIYSAARYGDIARKDSFGPGDELGNIDVPFDTDLGRNRRIVVHKGEDAFFGISDWWNQTTMEEEAPFARNRAYVFTDRKVYRPGQTVHFKALLMQQMGEQLSASGGQTLSMALQDVNGKELSKQTLTTNSYGSVSGEFVLPKGGLTGSFSLQSPFGSTSIQVEAYKRPRFEVVVEPYKGLAVVGDSVRLLAKASTLTGLSLSQARVEWRVSQYSHNWWRGGRAKSKVAASGTGVTNEKGEVEIAFLAEGELPSLRFGSNNYTIEVDITDANGETQSGSSTVFLGKHAYRIYTTTNAEVIGSNVRSISALVSLSNHSGENVSGQVNYILEKMRQPKELSREPFWSQADTILWQATLPKPELDYKTEVERVMGTGQWTVSGQAENIITLKQALATGHYRIRTTIIDVTGDTLTSIAPFRVVNPSQSIYDLGQALSLVSLNKDDLRSGQRAEFLVGSLYSPAYVQIYAVSGQEELINETVTLKGRWHKISIPVTSSMQGDISLQVATIKDKRIGSREAVVIIVNPDNELNLSLSTFRDKVKPGDEEAWTLSVTNGSGQAVEAEILALMYDAALDKYMANDLRLYSHYYRKDITRPWSWRQFYFNHQGGRYNDTYSMLSPVPYPYFFWTQQLVMGYGAYDMMRSGGELKSSEGAIFYSVEEDVEMEEVIPISQQSRNVTSVKEPSGVDEVMPQIRTNLNETAFFLPHLISSKDGKVDFSFTMPESLTRWRFMALAHTKDGASANVEQFIVAERELMVVPNLPRVVREGDELWFTANVLNSGDRQLGGMAHIEIRDALTGDLVSVGNLKEQIWEANPGGSALVSWRVLVPKGLKALEVSLSAFSGQISDGERHLVPVLPSRTLVTETQPLMLTQSGQHKLITPTLNEGTIEKFENFSLTYTEHAAWEVLGALPWLMERPHESADQMFNRFYAAAVARQIFKQYPAIERVLKVWSHELEGDENALLSALEKNPELKSALLTATPWLTEAQNDTERRRRLASLVTDGRLDNEIYSSLQLLKQMQLSDGAWPWFSGMYPSEETTTQILAGFGYLNKMGVKWDDEVQQMVDKSAQWLVGRLKAQMEEYEKLGNKDSVSGVPSGVIHKLYALSYWSGKFESEEVQFWTKALRQQLPREPVMLQSYAAFILQRQGYKQEAEQLRKSLEEYLLTGENETRFFKLPHGPHWSQSPIQTHVAAMEAFRETGGYEVELAGMENWLIQQKRSQQWRTTRATVSAIYVLAGSSRELFAVTGADKLLVDGQPISFGATETASGYRSLSLQGSSINSGYGNITIDKQNDTPSFASVLLSYYQSADSVQAGGFLEVQTSMLKRVMTDNRETWLPVDTDTELSPGDRLIYRLVIETPQALDFVHVDAPRAANLEPVDLLSGYRYASGLGYYLSVTDAGAGLFVDHLPKGRYTLSWEVTVSIKGKATQGPVQVSCFYAPEFAGHSQGGTINVKP